MITNYLFQIEQFLSNEKPPFKNTKKFRSNEPYNTGDVIESGGNYYN